MEKFDLISVLSANCGAAPLTGDIQKETCRKLGIPKLGQGICTARKRSCVKVLFLHLSAILFTGVVHGGEVCIAGGMRGGVVCVVGVCVHAKGHAWQGACVCEGCAGEMATDAGGTHPTGMHSCPRSLHFAVHCFYCNLFCAIIFLLYPNLFIFTNHFQKEVVHCNRD